MSDWNRKPAKSFPAVAGAPSAPPSSSAVWKPEDGFRSMKVACRASGGRGGTPARFATCSSKDPACFDDSSKYCGEVLTSERSDPWASPWDSPLSFSTRRCDEMTHAPKLHRDLHADLRAVADICSSLSAPEAASCMQQIRCDPRTEACAHPLGDAAAAAGLARTMLFGVMR